MTLSPKQQNLVVNALHVAIEVYRRDAVTTREAHPKDAGERLASEYTRQADECEQLANALEGADVVEIHS